MAGGEIVVDTPAGRPVMIFRDGAARKLLLSQPLNRAEAAYNI